MKNVVCYAAMGFAFGVSYMAGTWMWDHILEEKTENLVERLTKKD